MTKTLAILTMMIVGSVAFAHSKINATVPAHEAVLAAAPETIEFGFAKKIRLIKVDLAFSDQPKVPLDLGDQTSFATTFNLPLVPLGSGTYVIGWRGLSIDGHVMTGEFMFVVE